ncbi:MAG: carboxypeptidase regulatory-like domain-containing protein [Oscillochloris sp.]|nr:carboxypeptidase regulatory-like domain-containing protein [Oscillochloris sp.]
MRRISLMFAVLVAMLIVVAGISPVAAQSSNGWSFGLGWPGTNGPIYAIAAEGRYVYVAGAFTRAGNVAAQNIARWDRTSFSWSALDEGANGPVRALALADGKLYVGGDFTQAGALSDSGPLAIWDTTRFSWSALGAGLAGNVTALAADSSLVFVGGSFSRVGNQTYPNKVALVRYTHSSQLWGVIDSSSDMIRALALAKQDLYVGGTFIKSTVEGTYNYTQNVARWRGSWHDMAGGVSAGTGVMVTQLALDVNGDLYAIGDMGVIGGRTVTGIARWDGTSWSRLGTIAKAPYQAGLLAVGSNIFVGRSATANDCGFTKGIARWNGTTWQNLDAGVDGEVYALAAVGDELFVGGSFSRAGGYPASNFARWDLRIPFDSDQPGSYVIEGYLNDERSKPVPGATITAEGGQVALSDTNGLFTLRGLAPGAHTLTVVRDGYTFPTGQTFTVPPCLGRVTITGDALINNFTIGGRVELSDEWVRKDPPQVTLTAQRVTDSLKSTQTITAGESFTLTGLEPGTYAVSVAIPGQPALNCSDEDNPDAYQISPCARQVVIPPDGQQVSFELKSPPNKRGGTVQISLPPTPLSTQALRVSYVVHARQDNTQGWAVQLQLLSAAGQSIAQREIPVSAQALTWWETAVFDPLNPGAYQLRYTLRNAEGVFYGPYTYPFHIYKQADPRLVALADQLRDTSEGEIYDIHGFIVAVHTDTVKNAEEAVLEEILGELGSNVLKRLEFLLVAKDIGTSSQVEDIGGDIFEIINEYTGAIDWFVENTSGLLDFSPVAHSYVIASLQPTWDNVKADNQVFRDYLITIPNVDQTSVDLAEQESTRYVSIIDRRAEDEPVFGVGAPPGTTDPASFDAVLQLNPASLFLGETTLLNQDLFYSWTNCPVN